MTLFQELLSLLLSPSMWEFVFYVCMFVILGGIAVLFLLMKASKTSSYPRTERRKETRK